MPGKTYVFERDDQGRFVAKVDDPEHVRLFLCVEHFCLVEDEDAAEDTVAPVIPDDDDEDFHAGDPDPDEGETDPDAPPKAIVPGAATDPEGADTEKEEPDPFEGFTKAQMQAEAASRGIAFKKNQNAFELKKLVLEHDEANKQPAAAEGAGDPQEPAEQDLASLTKKELLAMAKGRGLKVSSRATKDDLVEAILEAEDEE
ncbi:Rho termination factor N-terminal domain-containing protein [Hoeflea poritis]|uniref:Rho termination factor N-terminal domain-containing protein n=1 Tax=Hoeflea poritis TaxID=2993659 RepID=A0ABT4VMJ7_9HYPH|nr:Rho termination factor N-terminal domain-containing protein [Hoeflea poritis]MDA4845946.1 Rho termination factor N-terminal domain-containing protein [Hoeflea poritis]